MHAGALGYRQVSEGTSRRRGAAMDDRMGLIGRAGGGRRGQCRPGGCCLGSAQSERVHGLMGPGRRSCVQTGADRSNALGLGGSRMGWAGGVLGPLGGVRCVQRAARRAMAVELACRCARPRHCPNTVSGAGASFLERTLLLCPLLPSWTSWTA
jgi:hypothetical protein